ncbi:hypothetical protein [Rathayibacter sp. VKM Ac-2801]|uniref:hypothetical protein n=1 Tax=Rathayibacter sp. VKM Ac-2801 TaxID=2609255 RepID=UPI00131FEE3D|nr:hypothetical protein [Rathayibacter sp. VKM Ac-2801]QHC71791.1 hypothetical protein GSU45_16280 [Rathayibacter sp. VKM Ac-2801]
MYVAAVLLSQYVLWWMTSSSSSSVSTAYAGYSLADHMVSSVWTSASEKTIDVAVPIAFASYAWWVIRALRATSGTLVGLPVRASAW